MVKTLLDINTVIGVPITVYILGYLIIQMVLGTERHVPLSSILILGIEREDF